MDVAAERNRVALPGASRGGFPSSSSSDHVNHAPASATATTPRGGTENNSTVMAGMRLPPERFCLTGLGWNLKDEWESEGEEDVVIPPPSQQQQQGQQSHTAETRDEQQQREQEQEEEDAEGDEDEDGRMEDVFGEEDTVMRGDEGEEDEDKEMTGT